MRHAEQLAAAALVFVVAASGMGLATAQTVGPIKDGATVSTAPEIVLVGRRVYGADGKRIGRVDAVETDGDGRIAAIDVALGILGLGPRTVRVPGDSIAQTGLEVRLALTAEEVGRLPSIDGEPE